MIKKKMLCECGVLVKAGGIGLHRAKSKQHAAFIKEQEYALGIKKGAQALVSLKRSHEEDPVEVVVKKHDPDVVMLLAELRQTEIARHKRRMSAIRKLEKM